MVKINANLLPVKAHYFFFMAAMGPILPFLPVIGKQLGVSEVAMGLILSIIPILFMVAKPVFGYILDYYRSQRKAVFIGLVLSTPVFFAFLNFIPQYEEETINKTIACSSISICSNKSLMVEGAFVCRMNNSDLTGTVKVLEVPGTQPSYCCEHAVTCPPDSPLVDLLCSRPWSDFYSSSPFWAFVVLLSLASVCYNVTNSVSDAICFDVLGGGNEKKYGQQRVWGTLGFGLSALLGGVCIDWWSGSGTVKDYTPAVLIAVVFTSVDLLCCRKLKLPELPKSSNISKDVLDLVRNPSIATFLLFAAFLGICESFIIFFLFWYLEDLAIASGTMHNIKLLQGLTVAAETLIGEIIFFPLSGRILRAVGYRHCLSLCFLAYTARLGLLSLVTDPWWTLAVELLQGPSYALSYTTVVAYASAVSPAGTSATVQGIAAGMDDGFGYSVGSLAGGFLYRAYGGVVSFRIFSGFALICCITHWILYLIFFRNTENPTSLNEVQEQEKRGTYSAPKEAADSVMTAS